ncbi:hypothetical protein ACN3XK_53270 [Actinomadura welshii]
MVDEMDLLKTLKDAEPVRPRAFEDARAVLQAALTTEETAMEKTTAGKAHGDVLDTGRRAPTAPRRRARWSARRTAGAGAAVLVAAAAAVALAVTSASGPGEPPAETPQAGNPVLVELAADNTPLSPEQEGDATLQIRNLSPTGDELDGYGIGLYTDDGTYYWGNDKKALRKAVAAGKGDDVFKGAIEVALYAVKGDVATARKRMAVANLPEGEKQQDLERERRERLKLAAEERGEEYVPPKPLTSEEKKQITDNHIWSNSIDALTAAPRNPQVRAGVLRIMATMPRVEVDRTTTAGKPTLTLVDSWPANGKFVETLIIDARTGSPVASSVKAPDASVKTVYYHSSRVTLADVKAGDF